MSDSFNAPVPNENEHIDVTAELMASRRQFQEEPTGPSEAENLNYAGSFSGAEQEPPPEPIAPYTMDDLFPEDDDEIQDRRQSAGADSQGDAETQVERRRRHRALISAPVRIRSLEVARGASDEISTTIDVSRLGILFETLSTAFYRGMEVAVTFPYVKTPGALQSEQRGLVVRVRELSGGRRTVAIALGMSVGTELIDASGRKLAGAPAHATYSEDSKRKKPHVLALDSDAAVRNSLKSYLTSEGYEVTALNNGPDAREFLKMFTPALVIAEIEGVGMPGYDLCAYIKGDANLKHIPVVLTTRSGYPSDYSNAHALGAVVCMAKPYKQERLGHVVRLLAPTAQAMEQTAPARAADPSRKPGVNGKNGHAGNGSNSSNGSNSFRISPIK